MPPSRRINFFPAEELYHERRDINYQLNLTTQTLRLLFHMADSIQMRGFYESTGGTTIKTEDFLHIIMKTTEHMNSQLIALNQDKKDALEALALQGITLESYRKTKRMLGVDKILEMISVPPTLESSLQKIEEER